MAKYTDEELMDGLRELHDAVAFGFTQAEKRSQDRDSALQAQMNRRFDRVDARFDEMKTDISEMKADISGMKTDISGLKTDMKIVKADISELKTDVKEIKGLIVREPKRKKP